MKNLERASLILALAACTGVAKAGPTITSEQFFTDRWGTSVAFPTLSGDYLHLFTTVGSSDPAGLVSAVATQGALVRDLNFFTGPIFAEKNFERFLTNTSLTGAWNLVATDTSGSTSGVFQAIADPQFLPLVTGLQVTGGGATPTLSWTLPDLTGFDVDLIRVRAVVAATGVQTFQSGAMSASATSFQLPAGILDPGVAYQFRVILDDIAGDRIENRSNTFSSVYSFAPAVPEPAAFTLLGVGLAAIALRRRRSRT